MSIFDKPPQPTSLDVYNQRFPEHGIVTIMVNDRPELNRLLDAAVKRGKQLTARELESVGAIDADDVPEGVFV
ncbi:hypothetical protein D1227_06380 [Henriciella mobilis]|uniref:hypothetical protein n=1 Tax=Henriciella mobilis TaxID=2305467 RepID=UPI000E670736|nr:hypothetical protein [Henriciella mobilis]RIJ15963.1 hypothetical protein D1231_09220 [Henriciella mobilis]RIJ21173.1 hypothetical protein D1227_12760 [Henriciella mobilis]RIJ23126.1 hypothetical protein D1227_06380 [Henriciella mobilis]